jgi:mono/diheme cytochrome c family protein
MGATLFLVLASGVSVAQEGGDVRSGRMLAQMTCAECHAIGKGQLRSRNGQAPTFAALASTPGMNAMNIRVALRTAHREMPNLALKSEEIEDVAAYILSLK